MVIVPSYNESLPYIVLEAAAAGLPVIATRVGGMTEIFGPDSNTLVTPRDIGGLADRMRHAINHPDEMKALAGRLRSRVRAEFSAVQMVDGVTALYRKMIETQAVPNTDCEEQTTSGVAGVPS
jgi:glycosyltransferase involved in cell wall biosynthesis